MNNIHLKYNKISKELENQIKKDQKKHWENPEKCDPQKAMRRNSNKDEDTLLRPAFVRDIEKILHLPFYNRYADKTQVFSFFNNDDITRRALHVQLVSRIARNIGRILGLNTDLIEGIALGHDLGHTPFGHAGEQYLNQLFQKRTGRFFNHNVHSVRVLDKMFCRNVSLQTLDGILCHNGEFEQQEYHPTGVIDFKKFDKQIEDCYKKGGDAIKNLVPATLEGCVVRLSDMIAYLGKDRQDAVTANLIDDSSCFSSDMIGNKNAEIINNIVVDIIENSYGKNYILLSPEVYSDLKIAKNENYKFIYKNEGTNKEYGNIELMFEEMYNRLLKDLMEENKNSPVFKHHLNFIIKQQQYYTKTNYAKEQPDQIIVDYMASMTDDYFIALYEELFGGKCGIKYHSYFENM